MKAVKKMSIFAITVLVIVFSLFLPNISSLTVDHHLSKQIKEIGNYDISLQMSDNIEILESVDLFHKLLYRDFNAVSDNVSEYDNYSEYGNLSVVELSEYSQVCRLNEEKVKKLAEEVIGNFSKESIADSELMEVTPNLFTRSNDEIAVKSGIYWRCLWIDKNAQATAIWIDDKSGQMVSLMMEYTDDSDSEIPEIVYDLGKYCLVHYQVDEVQCRKETDEYFFIDLIVNSNGEDFVYSVPVRWQNRELLFFNS